MTYSSTNIWLKGFFNDYRNTVCVSKKRSASSKRSSVDYLCVIVGNGKVWMDPVKVTTVADWKVPANKKGVQEFLGFVKFYRRFIKDFSKIARPLHELTG